MSSSPRGHVLLIEALDGSSQRIAERMLPLGVQPIIVKDFDEAGSILTERRVLVNAVLIPTDFSSQNLKRDIRDLGRAGPASGLIFGSIGRTPRPDERKKLRSAGLQLALWEPFDDGTLRFQLNRAVNGDRDDHHRRALRVPTYLLARIYVGERTKDAVVYSLSEGGCFLETPRASMDGANLDLELRLPVRPIRVKGLVVFSNVPGNLQRPNLPLGMGVRFSDFDDEDLAALTGYVKGRLAELDL